MSTRATTHIRPGPGKVNRSSRMAVTPGCPRKGPYPLPRHLQTASGHTKLSTTEHRARPASTRDAAFR
jgi:hypothetical protein